METSTSASLSNQSGKLFVARDFNFTDVKLDLLIQGKHNLIRTLPTTSLEAALDIMRTNNISGLPIYDFSKRKHIGILDFFDVVVYVAFGSFRKELLESDLENVSFGKMLAGDLLAISNSERFIWNFEAEDSLEAVLVQLAKGVQRVVVNKRKVGSHVPITSEVADVRSLGSLGPSNQDVRHIMLTQRDVVDFLYQWASDRRFPVLLQTLEDLRLVTTLKGSPLVTVPDTFTALDAMQKMYHSKVSAVAVVDGEGKLLANLSNTDIRYLTQDRLSSIFLPVCLFLSEVQGKKPAKPIAAHISSTLGEVMLKVITARVKRVWLVDSNWVPVGVVTLTDIISEFASHEGTLLRPAEQTLRR